MTTRRDVLRATAVLPALGALPAAGGSVSKLACEPLAGHFTHESVRLWIQADHSVTATVDFKPAKAAADVSASTVNVQLEASRANSATVEISKLKADTRYEYTVTLAGGSENKKRHFRTAPTPDASLRNFPFGLK